MSKLSQYIVVGVAEDGRYIRKRVYGNSKAELERNRLKLLREYEDITHPSSITFREYAEKWLRVYKSSREVATLDMYENCLKKTKTIDYVPLKDIRQTDLQSIITENADHPNVCSKLRLLFRQIWGSAIADGILSKDITTRLNLPVLVTGGTFAHKGRSTGSKDGRFRPHGQDVCEPSILLRLASGGGTGSDATGFQPHGQDADRQPCHWVRQEQLLP